VTPFNAGDILLWGIVSAISWAVAGCICSLCVFKPLGSMVVDFVFGCPLIGACAGVLALFSFFCIYAMTRDLSASYGLHLTLMSVLAFIVGLVGAFSVLPEIALPPGVEIRDAVVRAPICAIMAMIAMMASLRAVAKFG
jgi:hypothetical protein